MRLRPRANCQIPFEAVVDLAGYEAFKAADGIC